MNITRTSGELTAKQKYNLTMNPSTTKMADSIGQIIEISCFCIYEDVNSKGEEQRILAIETLEGEVLGTNSPTFISDFERMWDLFDAENEKVNSVLIISGTSKSGRQFITCRHES